MSSFEKPKLKESFRSRSVMRTSSASESESRVASSRPAKPAPRITTCLFTWRAEDNSIYGVKPPRGSDTGTGSEASHPQLIGGLAVHRRIKPFLGLGPDAHRCDQVDQLQHHVREAERVGRAADAGGDLLGEECPRAVH